MAADKPICAVDGCDKPSRARGWCITHYNRWRRTGDAKAEPQPPKRNDPVCKVPGCSGDAKKPGTALGYCASHYWRFKRHGDPLGGGSSPGERVQWLRGHASHEGDECLIFPYKSETTRGQVHMEGVSMNASRAMCWIANGPPPTDAHYACHNCRGGDDGCVNPKHLRWDTPAANQADRVSDGTSNRGSRHGLSKYTEAQVKRFKDDLRSMSIDEAAKRAEMSLAYAKRVARGQRWGWLKD